MWPLGMRCMPSVCLSPTAAGRRATARTRRRTLPTCSARRSGARWAQPVDHREPPNMIPVAHPASRTLRLRRVPKPPPEFSQTNCLVERPLACRMCRLERPFIQMIPGSLRVTARDPRGEGAVKSVAVSVQSPVGPAVPSRIRRASRARTATKAQVQSVE